MTTWIEPPPRQKGMGCLGKGCLLFILFLVLLCLAFIVGGYVGVRYVVTSPTPRPIPQVETSEPDEQAVQTRWENFKEASQSSPAEPTPQIESAPAETASPTPSPNRIELTAGEINQLFNASRNTRGKVFVSIDNNVANLQFSIPLSKMGFRGRFLNGNATVRASADKNPRSLQIALHGVNVPEKLLKMLLGTRSLGTYIDEYSGDYNVSTLTIEDNKVILESSAAR
ncbi:MAG: hypothetical protein ABJB09_01375 [Verrucomicrobiota bacterium]